MINCFFVYYQSINKLMFYTIFPESKSAPPRLCSEEGRGGLWVRTAFSKQRGKEERGPRPRYPRGTRLRSIQKNSSSSIYNIDLYTVSLSLCTHAPAPAPAPSVPCPCAASHPLPGFLQRARGQRPRLPGSAGPRPAQCGGRGAGRRAVRPSIRPSVAPETPLILRRRRQVSR